MRRRARKGGGRQVELVIEAIGARGDGYGTVDGRPVFVPFTVHGDRVLARTTGEQKGGLRAEAVELLAEGPGRVAPPCPHFGLCGGCALQHLDEAHYVAWKQALVSRALAQRGIMDAVVAPLCRVGQQTRRRMTLAAVKNGGRLRLGLHERASHTVIDLETCLLVTPGLLALLPPLRTALKVLLADGEEADVTVNETDSGFDVLILSHTMPALAAREALAEFAQAADLARLSWGQTPRPGDPVESEPVAIRRPPVLRFGAVDVEPPPGGFLQPTVEGEALLVEAVLAGIPEGAARVADLYAGCGTFTFPLAARCRVHAVEGDGAALAALWTAARRADMAGRVSVEERDLARDPLDVGELNEFDAVVFDPPRIGAREQAIALAASTVPTVLAVSCNPATFARDARILIDGGYTLAEVLPVDQFPWSGHLELVGRFTR
ncbi:MAG: class I SAM-dependent RNA methyltransferase [Alphaproteobacteria bacterium]